MSDKQQKSCPSSQEITPAEVKDSMPSILEKMGASETCKQSADTYWAQLSASLQGRLDTPISEAELNTQLSTGAGSNSMSQSGCGTFIANALKIANTTKVLNCILQNASRESGSNANFIQSIEFVIKDITNEEKADRIRLINSYKDENPKDEYIDRIINSLTRANKSIAETNSTLSKEDKIPLLEINYDKIAESYDQTIKSLSKTFERSLIWNNVELTQSVGADVKLISSISENDKLQIESLLKDVATNTAESQLNQTSGANALSPNIRQMTQQQIERNTNLTGAQIANKINQINNQFKSEQNVKFVVPGNIIMNNVSFKQDMVISLCTQALITSAMDAGIKTAAELLSSNDTKSRITTVSKGIDDIIKAQGEANAAAIAANKSTSSKTMGSFISFIIFTLFVIGLSFYEGYCKKNGIEVGSLFKAFKWFLIALMILSILLLVIFIISSWRQVQLLYLGATPTADEKEKTLNRPLKLYNLLWKSMMNPLNEKDSPFKNCDKDFTVDDIINLGWDKLSDSGLKIAIDLEANKIKEYDSVTIDKCYLDPSKVTPPPETTSQPSTTLAPASTSTKGPTTTPIPCEKGYYCPSSSSKIECPVGTYNSKINQTSASSCLNCKIRSFCPPGTTENVDIMLAVGIDNNLYTSLVTDVSFKQIPNSGSVKSVCFKDMGTIIGVGTDNKLYTKTSFTNSWTIIPNSGDVISVSMLSNGYILGIGSNKKLYTRTNLTDSWVLKNNTVDFISACDLGSGKMLAVKADNDLYYGEAIDKDFSEWKKVTIAPASLKFQSVSSSGVGILGVSTNNEMWLANITLPPASPLTFISWSKISGVSGGFISVVTTA